jgi:1,4-alpha-glucan branching enzyme
MFMAKSKKKQSQESETEMKSPAAEQQSREVDFVLECSGAEHGYVCGGFNDWHPTCRRMIGNPDPGLWEKRLLLPPGRHEYKFVVDGKWLHDPDAGENVFNIYGSLNSVVEVRP